MRVYSYICLLGIGFIIGVIADDEFFVKPMRAKAVELGAAEWVVNPKDGTTKFQWKEKP